MKRIMKNVAVLSLLLILVSFTNKETSLTYSLTVEVNNTRNSEGVVQFSLYNQDGSIPDQKYEKYYRILTGSINEGTSSVIFTDLSPGTYVVNILHDENVNGKVDKGFLLPIEGLGFSNYTSLGLTNRPKYSKASFTITGDKKIEVKVIYM
jgi:uncharacterized protein (DUF2141 family)